MPEFKDNQQKEWVIRLDGPKIRAVREASEINLADASDGKLFVRLAEDVELLVDVLWVLCRDQAGEITDVEFADRLFGDPVERAATALIDAVILSFPSGEAVAVRSLWKQQAAMLQRGMELAEAKLTNPAVMAAAEAKMEAELDEVFNRALGISTGPTGVTKPPAKSESAPTG